MDVAGAGQRLKTPGFSGPLSARLAKRIDDVRASYWFIPSMLVLAAFVLSQMTLFADAHPEALPGFVGDMSLITSAEGARAVVSVVATSMMGVAGVLFSITMLAVSFASGQFGPRLIGNFMRDRHNQWSLGLLIATFTFALLILRAVANTTEDGAGFVPHLSVLVAMALALVGVLVVILHVHHVPETISVSNIIAGLGRRFSDDLTTLMKVPGQPKATPTGPHCDVRMQISGYVHNVAEARLSVLAEAKGWQIEICADPGEFVHCHMPMLRVWGVDGLSDEMQNTLRQTVALGDAKTEHQNVIFVAEQLVEIVARAMSPGVNDPFTAMSAMQWLAAGLTDVVGETEALAVFKAPGVIAKPIRFEALLAASLGDCGHYTAKDPLTRRTLLTILADLQGRATPANRRSLDDLAARITTAA